MFTNYLSIAWRHIKKNKYPVGISVVGLAVAFACAIVAYFNYELNSTFDAMHQNRGDIYRVNFKHITPEGNIEKYGICPIPLGGLLRENKQLIDAVIRYETTDRDVKIKTDVFRTEVAFTDPEFLDVFDLAMISGVKSIAEKNLLLSDLLAKKYFGTENAVGQSLTFIINQQPVEFTVAGVYKNFEFNNSFHFQILTNLDNFYTTAVDKRYQPDNWKVWNTTFLYVKNKSNIAAIETNLQQFIDTQNLARPDLKVSEFYLDPLEGMAERARASQMKGHWFGQPLPPAAVIVLFVIASVLLIIACVNLTNTTLATAAARLKEIGLRKVLGGRKTDLRKQFLWENLILCVLSLALGILLAQYFLPAWDALWPDLNFNVNYLSAPFIIFLTSVTLVAAIASGAYPAFYIASFNPLEVFKGKLKFGGTSLLTRILLILQLTISLVAIIFNLAFYYNTVYQENYDLGFDSHSVIEIPVQGENEFIVLKQQLEKDPRITTISGSEHHISSSTYKASVKIQQQAREIDALNIGDSYLETLNIQLLEGRAFEKNSANDEIESMLVNEEFVRAFQIKGTPIGQRVLWNDSVQVFITGVVKDVYLNALFQPVQPIAFRYCRSASYRFLTLKAAPTNLLSIQKSAESDWKNLFLTRAYEGKIMDEEMSETLQHFRNVTILYSFLGSVTMLLSISGLFSLVTLHIQRRLKEIGLRKMMGASSGRLIWLAGKPFLIILGISCILGTAGGIASANIFMDAIWEYYQRTNIETVLIAISGILAVAVASVFLRIRRATTINPVDIIRET